MCEIPLHSILVVIILINNIYRINHTHLVCEVLFTKYLRFNAMLDIKNNSNVLLAECADSLAPLGQVCLPDCLCPGWYRCWRVVLQLEAVAVAAEDSLSHTGGCFIANTLAMAIA